MRSTSPPHWQNYMLSARIFGAQLAASDSTMQSLIEDERTRVEAKPLLDGELVLQAAAFAPTVWDIKGAITKVSLHKAVGEYLLSDELLKACREFFFCGASAVFSPARA